MRDALDRIYREHRQGLFTLALSITRDRQRAEDAVHEAFVRLCRSDATPTGDLTAYVFAAVRNAANDEMRRLGTRQRLARSIYDGQMIDPPPTPDGVLLDGEMQQLIRQAVDALPGAARQTLVLKLYAGLTFEQVAQTMNEPMGTITSRYRRSLEKLKERVSHLV